MPLTKLDTNASLVVIDLQKGIVDLPTVHPGAEIVARVARLARAFRERGLPVVLVVDASGMGQVMGAGPMIPIVADFGASPITKNFTGSATFFPMARTASIADKAKSIPETVELLKTSARSFAIPSLPKGEKIKFDPKVDTPGPLSIGVSGNRKVGEKNARLVVIGNSQFAMNPYLTQLRNGDLFYNSIDWLAADENLISIRPKSPTSRRINLSAAQASALHWLDQLFLPGLVILAGIMIWAKRR